MPRVAGEPGETRAARSTAATPTTRALRILLAEDYLINQKVAVNLLRCVGHETTVAGNGREALKAFEAGAFDLILMDLQMPEMDGFEAVAAIRAAEARTGSHIAIVALTAHAMKGDREKCLDCGFDGYLSKPIRTPDLIQALKDFAPASPAEVTAEDPDPQVPPFDHGAALESMGGDLGLFGEVARIFLDDAPRLTEQTREAIRQSDAKALSRAAHTLKGAAGHFAAPEVIDAARHLEWLGQSDDLAGAGVAMATLQRALDRVLPALRESLTRTAEPESGIRST
jgi:CheY-like chemotaxis protein/HPt (histidine-containing phosphotransfer) domain-containing protein